MYGFSQNQGDSLEKIMPQKSFRRAGIGMFFLFTFKL